MDTIKFKLGDMDDVFDENEDLFDEHKDYSDTEKQEGSMYVIANFRIVIPELHVCFREADWYELDPDPDDPEAWEIQDSVYLLYEENEKDINQWIFSCTKSIDYSLYEPCEKAGYPMKKGMSLNAISSLMNRAQFIYEEVRSYGLV